MMSDRAQRRFNTSVVERRKTLVSALQERASNGRRAWQLWDNSFRRGKFDKRTPTLQEHLQLIALREFFRESLLSSNEPVDRFGLESAWGSSARPAYAW